MFSGSWCSSIPSELDSMTAEISQEMGIVAPPAEAGQADHELRVPPPEAGVFLTWEDLWVTATDGKGASHVILAGLTGFVQPGEVLAIMGPSGCGKSTLLDALAGRLGSSMRQSGHILVNGRRQRLSFGTSAYVTQDDILMTTLTVREAVHYSAQLQLPKSMSRSEKRERAEMTMQEMGLQDAMDTRIGGYASKGISGGQKRRVSICIEILTRPKLLFLDEPTSGLDSAASFHVMTRISHLAKLDGMTIIASIHQPSSEVFELFDNLCLLSSGKTIYFGPTSSSIEFFSLNGFPCPTFRNPSDHFLRTINKDFDKESEEAGSSKGLTKSSKAIDVLTSSYKQSQLCQDVARRVTEICTMDGMALVKKGSQAGFAEQCIILTKRSFVNMNRDLGYYWLRFVIYIVLCLFIGSAFYDVGHTYGSIQARGTLLMFVVGFLTFMAIGGFPSFVEDMKIFRRERLNGHYGVAAFVISNTLSSAPYLAAISTIPGAIAYYMTGLQRGFDHFMFFCFILYMCMLLTEGLMMIVASLVPNYLVGIITGAGIQALMILSSGFFRLPNDMPKPVMKFPMYYIAFHRYANQGYFKNEFLGLQFPSNGCGKGVITGEWVVRVYWQMQVGYSKWVDLAVLCGMAVFYRVLFLIIVKAGEELKPALLRLLNAPTKRAIQVIGQPLEDIDA